MMHRFECVGRNCAHKLTLELFKPTRRSRVGFRQNSKVNACALVLPTHEKHVHHLFYRMGAKNLPKIPKFASKINFENHACR